MTEDEVASMSTDNSGLGGSIRDFFAPRSKNAERREQDLGGFGGRPGAGTPAGERDLTMETIGEEGEGGLPRDGGGFGSPRSAGSQ